MLEVEEKINAFSAPRAVAIVCVGREAGSSPVRPCPARAVMEDRLEGTTCCFVKTTVFDRSSVLNDFWVAKCTKHCELTAGHCARRDKCKHLMADENKPMALKLPHNLTGEHHSILFSSVPIRTPSPE